MRFFRQPKAVRIHNYPNSFATQSLLDFIAAKDMSSIERLCAKYPSIINHCSRSSILFPVSAALAQPSSDPIIQYFLKNGASLQLKRTREIIWVGGGAGGPVSVEEDSVRKQIEAYNGALKTELLRRFELEKRALLVKQEIDRVESDEKLPALLALFAKKGDSLHELMDIPVCDGKTTFDSSIGRKRSMLDTMLISPRYEQVVGIPSSPSLKLYLTEQCNALSDHQFKQIVKELDGVFSFDFGQISEIQPRR